MQLMSILPETETLAAVAAAISAISAVVVVSWPYLFRDTFELRMRMIEGEREKIRLKERARQAAAKENTSLRSKPKRFFQTIVDRFNLAKQAEDGEVARKLKMAGFRGHSPVVTYLAIRLIAPFVLFAVCAIYIPLVLRPDLNIMAVGGIAVLVGSLGYFLPDVYIKNKTTKRQKEIRRAWPDALDLLLISVESGMSIEAAFRKVAEEIGVQSVALAEELSIATAELSYLHDRRQAYENLGGRTGLEGVRAVVTSLIQAEKYGTPVGQSLRVLAQENRDMRMSEAEKKAASLPPKLTVPMILFFLPVLFAVILTPAIIQVAGIQ